MKLEIDGFTLVGETYGEFFDKPELETALDVYEKEVFTIKNERMTLTVVKNPKNGEIIEICIHSEEMLTEDNQ